MNATTPTENPYRPPTSSQAVATVGRRWLLGGAISGMLGGLVSGSASYWIYVEDPRTGTSAGPSLIVAVAGAALCGGALWAIAGAFTGIEIRRVLIANLCAVVVAGTWVLVAGTYADVLGAAAVVGWPLGGLVGSLLPYARRLFL